ncbi:MAG TPA: L,D-transpeptidase family protein [Anaerolineales bacterium]
MQATKRLTAHELPTGQLRRAFLGLGLAVGGLVGLLLAILLGVYGFFRLSGSIAPGVSVGQVPVGGLQLAEAADRLDQAWNQDLVLVAVDTSEPGRVWQVLPGEFGLRVEAVESAELAHNYGRQNGLIAGGADLVTGFTSGWELAPVIEFDAEQAGAALEAWGKTVELPAADATLSLEAGQVLTTPSQWGSRLDLEASLALLTADPAAILLRYGFIPLVTEPVPPQVLDVAAAADQAEALLSRTIAVRAYDPVTDEWLEWAPSRAEIGSWMRIGQEGSRLSVSISEEAVRASVGGFSVGEERTLDAEAAAQSLLAGLSGQAADPIQLHYLPRYYTVLPQDTLISISFKVGIPYWKWLEINPQVIARGLVPGESLTIPPRDAMLELPVIPGKRIVVSISEQHMWLYQDGELLRENIVSTGIPNSPTMPGLFQVKSRYLNAYASNWDLYMPHFLGIYHAAPNFLNGIHGLPLLSNGTRLWASVLGRPVSYGCVVLDLEAAEHLYGWAEDGVVVEIRS